MKTIEDCPCCKSKASIRWPALTAPFIAEYVLDSLPTTCHLIECGQCGLRFFDGRYDNEEVQRLYSSYRGERYFRVRHRHEFWYLQRHNIGTGHNARVVYKRRSRIEKFLRAHLDLGSVMRVLDYGGDSGQFIPDAIGQERFVFEVSEATPVLGVHRLSSDESLINGSYDLVLLNNVLEHASDPSDLLSRIGLLLVPGRGILHIEVPLERYGLRWVDNGVESLSRLKGLAKHPRLLRWIDFYSTLFRTFLGVVPPLGILKMHEHLNFFHEKSLSLACQSAGMTVIAIESRGEGPGSFLAVLAKHNHRATPPV